MKSILFDQDDIKRLDDFFKIIIHIDQRNKVDHLLRFRNQLDRLIAQSLEETDDHDEDKLEELAQELLQSWSNVREEHEQSLRSEYGCDYESLFDQLNKELIFNKQFSKDTL